ncbi:Short-chain dehydrogenase/reductase SDR [Penicillium expansum]|uniref:Short-chain dehydrogenase/reductase SDR n=1 Tax=Penicillium expansum TaxID=27334 RepID=A0A0A2JH51_PENEN|nr:Short-chain dehydrogenase/reductase SDR [Penicillium expansum]KGO45156.1 Short-chain dehydrogenase/reductase SDR [Penicillium expansum]KGO51640.1 Short-chain dehydrogenase/reductase SDR [Penicillium expansum]
MSVLSSLEGFSSVLFSNTFIKLPYPEGDLSGQTIIVTGSNQGLGFEASRHLLRLGVGKLIMAVRDLVKGEAAKRELLQSTSREESSVEVWLLDMDSYFSVKSFASRAATLPRLDALLANAGIFTHTFSMSEEDEKTITVNVVSTFLLVLLLVPKLRESASKFNITPRIAIPNSGLHYMASLEQLDPKNEGGIFKSLNNKEATNMSGRYPLSKLLVLFGVRAFANQFANGKAPLVIINTPNPSFCKSQLARETDNFGQRVFEKVLARTTEEGSRTLVHGILADEKSNGQYLTDCHVHSPSCIVTDKKGVMIQEAFFKELVTKLEKIAPGVTSCL